MTQEIKSICDRCGKDATNKNFGCAHLSIITIDKPIRNLCQNCEEDFTRWLTKV